MRGGSTLRSHPPGCSLPAQVKILTAASWDSAHQEHHGLLSFLCWTSGLKSMRDCPGDAAALAAPDSVTLKRCCCREPPQRSHGSCANPAAPGGLCWGSQRWRQPSPGSCQVGRAPRGNSSSPSLEGEALPFPPGAWPDDAPWLPRSAATGMHRHSPARTPRAPGKDEGLCLLLLLPPALAELEGSS